MKAATRTTRHDAFCYGYFHGLNGEFGEPEEHWGTGLVKSYRAGQEKARKFLAEKKEKA